MHFHYVFYAVAIYVCPSIRSTLEKHRPALYQLQQSFHGLQTKSEQDHDSNNVTRSSNKKGKVGGILPAPGSNKQITNNTNQLPLSPTTTNHTTSQQHDSTVGKKRKLPDIQLKTMPRSVFADAEEFDIEALTIQRGKKSGTRNGYDDENDNDSAAHDDDDGDNDDIVVPEADGGEDEEDDDDDMLAILEAEGDGEDDEDSEVFMNGIDKDDSDDESLLSDDDHPLDDNEVINQGMDMLDDSLFISADQFDRSLKSKEQQQTHSTSSHKNGNQVKAITARSIKQERPSSKKKTANSIEIDDPDHYHHHLRRRQRERDLTGNKIFQQQDSHRNNIHPISLNLPMTESSDRSTEHTNTHQQLQKKQKLLSIPRETNHSNSLSVSSATTSSDDNDIDATVVVKPQRIHHSPFIHGFRKRNKRTTIEEDSEGHINNELTSPSSSPSPSPTYSTALTSPLSGTRTFSSSSPSSPPRSLSTIHHTPLSDELTPTSNSNTPSHSNNHDDGDTVVAPHSASASPAITVSRDSSSSSPASPPPLVNNVVNPSGKSHRRRSVRINELQNKIQEFDYRKECQVKESVSALLTKPSPKPAIKRSSLTNMHLYQPPEPTNNIPKKKGRMSLPIIHIHTVNNPTDTNLGERRTATNDIKQLSPTMRKTSSPRNRPHAADFF